MKTPILRWFLAWAAALAFPATMLRADINPALQYYQAFLLAPDISDADFDYLATNNLWSATLPPRFGELVSKYDGEFKILREAAKSTARCDWGIDFSQGPATMLPHLARCKAAMIGARYRVAWALQQNRQADARDDLLAAFALARNIARDGTLISVLVQAAAEAIGCDIIAESYGKFSTQTLQEIVQGIDALPARATVAASIGFEKITFHDWLVGKILELQKVYPGEDAKVMAAIHDLMPGFEETEQASPGDPSTGLWEQLSKASGNTSDGVLRLLREEDHIYDRLAVLMALPYAEFNAAAKKFSVELKGAQNPLVAPAVPACLKARQREFKMQVWLGMLHAALEYRLRGASGLHNVADPCGSGPFVCRRFVFEGVDRGFELRSAFEGSGFPEVLIFVEKTGAPFLLGGPHAGDARAVPTAQK